MAGRRFPSELLAGLLVAGLGLALLLERVELVELDPVWEWWPLVLVGIGAFQLFERRWLGGSLWVLAGGWVLLWTMGRLVVSPLELFLPVVLTVTGAVLACQALFSPRLAAEPEERFDLLAFWSGNGARLRSPSFRGGSATAVMGGCEVDLTSAELGAAEVVIHVVAFWGGVEVRVPQHCTIVDRVVPVLGGATVPANPLAEPDRRLTIKGLAVMGGVEVSSE